MKLKTITFEKPVERKILAFQFLTIAVRFAEIGRIASSIHDLEKCAAQMREAYDSALFLSTRVSFTGDDCRAFDSGAAYVEESFVALRDRKLSVQEHGSDICPHTFPWPREWEPMWGDPGQNQLLPVTTFPAQVVRRHLKRIEGSHVLSEFQTSVKAT